MARPKSKGAYVPLAAQYFMDDAILEAGPDAELLFIRILSFLAAVPSDGFITDRQVAIVSAGLRAPQRRIDSLLKVELIERVSGGFLVRSWLKWNRSADDVGKLLAKDRERKARKHAADGPDSVRNPAGIRTDSRPQYRAEQSSTEQKEIPTESLASEVADATARPDVEHLLDLLDAEIERNGAKKPSRTKKNRDAARLLLDRDGKSVEQVENAIRWAQGNEFWRSNILSMAKLREKWDQLSMQAKREAAGNVTPISNGRREEIRDGIKWVNGQPTLGGPQGMTQEQFEAWRSEREAEAERTYDRRS